VADPVPEIVDTPIPTNNTHSPHVTLMSRPSTSSPADTSIQPVTRSRTLFYLSIRDSITPTHNRGTIKTGQYGDTLDIADNEEEERLIEGTGRGKGLPPKWYAT